MTENTAQKWFAKRQSTKARTDEDAAMAYVVEGPFATKRVAHVALADMLRKEVEGWREHKMDASRDERALARVVAGETDVVEGNVRWFIVEVTGNPAAPGVEQAKYKAGDRLYFRPMPDRAPWGIAIAEGDVEVVEVVDHGSATAYSPRFTYVVRALNGSGTQGTDDRELTEIDFPLAPVSEQAATLVRVATEAPVARPSVAEELVAHELADAIERGDKRAADYHRATLEEIAKIKRIVVALGGHWR